MDALMQYVNNDTNWSSLQTSAVDASVRHDGPAGRRHPAQAEATGSTPPATVKAATGSHIDLTPDPSECDTASTPSLVRRAASECPTTPATPAPPPAPCDTAAHHHDHHLQRAVPSPPHIAPASEAAEGVEVLLQELRSTALQLSQRHRYKAAAAPPPPALHRGGSSSGGSSSGDVSVDVGAEGARPSPPDELRRLRDVLARERRQHSATVEMVADLLPRLERQQQEQEARHASDLRAHGARQQELEAENVRLRHELEALKGASAAAAALRQHSAFEVPSPAPLQPQPVGVCGPRSLTPPFCPPPASGPVALPGRRHSGSLDLPQRPPSFRHSDAQDSRGGGGVSVSTVQHASSAGGSVVVEAVPRFAERRAAPPFPFATEGPVFRAAGVAEGVEQQQQQPLSNPRPVRRIRSPPLRHSGQGSVIVEMRDGRARIPSLPGMPGHLQSTIAARVGRDTRPMTSADVIVMDQRKTGFLQGRRIGIVSAVLNMTNAIIGSGVLGLPYIASTSGIGLFAILLVITACVIDYSLQLLIAAACVTHQPGQRFSYELLGEQAFGMNGRLLVSLMIVMQNTANMTSYIVVFKDVIADIMGLFTDNTLLTDERFMTIMMCALVVLPLSSSSRLGPLAYVGVLQIVMVMGFVFYVMAMAIDKGDSFRTEPHTYPDGSVHDGSDDPGSNKSLAFFSPSRDTFLAMPTFCFSFICHTALLPIYDELQEADDLGRTRRPRKRIAVVVHMAIAIATTLYVIVSVSGYYLFGDEVQSDVLKNFADNRFAPLNHVARIAFTLTVIMSVPLQCFPFRKAFSSIIDILMGQLTPLTSLAKDVWATQDYKELDAEDRADALGIDLRRVGHDATRDYIEFLLLQPNQYSYTVPEQVDVKVLGAALDRYIHNIRYGELMLTYATESPAEGAMDTEDDFEVEGLCPAPSDGWVLHLSKTFFGIGTCLFLALTVPQIKEVFAVAGATSSVWLELILPAAIYIKLSLRKSNLSDVRRYGSIIDEKENDSDDDIEVATDELKDGVSRWVFILPTAMLVLGALVFVISWAGNIWRWVDGG